MHSQSWKKKKKKKTSSFSQPEYHPRGLHTGRKTAPCRKSSIGLSSEEILFLPIPPLIYSCSILTEWLRNSWFESCHTASQQAYIIYRVLYEEV